MTENLKEILRDVFSVDTEAGYRIRYHIIRALACEDYAKTISFDPRAWGLLGIFEWRFTSEGRKYWSDIRNLSMGRPEYI
ncbi:MAG: hypothetical protein IMF11_15235 [Proteobacteria bacterium]|nr:hypothetical protein [Pseudomonadota bacterium]